MIKTDYKDYDPNVSDDDFYNEYPSASETREFVEQLLKETKNLETGVLVSGWDETFGYGQLKRNIAYLNNQLTDGMLMYNDSKLVLVNRENDEVISDEIIQTGNGKKWKLTNGDTINAAPHQNFYWDKGFEVRIIVFEMELYFLLETEKNRMLKYKERVLEKEFKELPIIYNVFAKENLEK